MKKDEMLPGRRMFLRVGACLGAAAALRMLTAEDTGAPERKAAQAAAGPQAAAPRLKSTAYRLEPMTAEAPPQYRTALPPVRRRPFLSMPELGPDTMVLTFDDGPDPRYTPEILRTLREHDVRAMFFVCGEMATDNRDLLREMRDDGHVIGNHSWTHPLLIKMSREAVRDEMTRTSEVVEEVLGERPQWFRAPYGAWNRNSFQIGAELGMEPMGWTLDTLDWTTPGTDTIVRRVQQGAAPGVVVLSHDAGGDRSQSVAALRTYLPRLLAAGYRLRVPPKRR
ncbi:polysaccharide deacetylase family protein [Streptomyces sp. TLI_146]|uniref:polysaccharide deacetylase family protein n=1 Tax=Streptomyces sp. TLI_146 TaxID=1938858 RepID=UPI000C70272E|nr:polysaccharide deacetylase family protein [Streptomyces sp. TLI_146]PKV89078.1 peptidoglycan/xylan/chitin deacetylase (PgdA/CDA1 family) [Streptomyces sp. TLI_146]